MSSPPASTGLRFVVTQTQIRSYLLLQAKRNEDAAKKWRKVMKDPAYIKIAIARSHRIGLDKARGQGTPATKMLTETQMAAACVEHAKNNERAAEHERMMADAVHPDGAVLTMQEFVDLTSDNTERASPPEPTPEDYEMLAQIERDAERKAKQGAAAKAS